MITNLVETDTAELAMVARQLAVACERSLEARKQSDAIGEELDPRAYVSDSVKAKIKEFENEYDAAEDLRRSLMTKLARLIVSDVGFEGVPDVLHDIATRLTDDRYETP